MSIIEIVHKTFIDENLVSSRLGFLFAKLCLAEPQSFKVRQVSPPQKDDFAHETEMGCDEAATL